MGRWAGRTHCAPFSSSTKHYYSCVMCVCVCGMAVAGSENGIPNMPLNFVLLATMHFCTYMPLCLLLSLLPPHLLSQMRQDRQDGTVAASIQAGSLWDRSPLTHTWDGGSLPSQACSLPGTWLGAGAQRKSGSPSTHLPTGWEGPSWGSKHATMRGRRRNL